MVIRGILSKEFYQHRLLLLWLPILITCGWVLFLGMKELMLLGGSQFYNLSWFLWFIFPLFTLLLANSLIADEFRKSTQLFLEGLPVSRFAFLAVKYVIGMLAAVLTALLLVGMTSSTQWNSEGLSLRFALVLWIKTLLWAWFCWAASFALAFLGRYRFIIGFIVVFTLLFVERELEIQVTHFGPFHLIDEQYAYERYEIPMVAIGTTLGIILLLTILGFVFGIVRDATLASMLAEKMSYREKLTMTALVAFVLFVIASVIERQTAAEPLYLPGSVDVSSARVAVSVSAAVSSPTTAEMEALQGHADSMMDHLDEVAEFLNIKNLPKVFLVHRRDFDPDRYELGDLDTRQGVLIRLNAIASAPDGERWLRMAIRSVLLAHQHNRLDSDTRDWVVTGFPIWWLARSDKGRIVQEFAVANSVSQDDASSLSESELVRWRAYKKRVGEERAQLAAGAIMFSLSERAKAEDMRAFLSHVLGYEAPYDFRATIHDYWYSVSSVLRATTGLTLADLVSHLHGTLLPGAVGSGDR